MPVIAVGNPLGFVGAVSSGVIHAIRPMVSGGTTWIQADLRLAPGNSGGPLATIEGHVVGLNTMVVSGGLALSIPSRALQHFLRPAASQRSLGVVVRHVVDRKGKPGLMVLEIVPNSAAERASLFPGDILLWANDVRLQGPDDLQTAIDEASASPVLNVRFQRAGNTEIRRVIAVLDSKQVPSAA